MRDAYEIFQFKIASPMLIAENKPAFDSREYIYELKFDGTRCLAYLSPNQTELYDKRNKNMSLNFPEFQNLHNQVYKTCIIDGEIVVLKNGKPSFADLQNRSMMKNPFKIELAAAKNQAAFVVFDILFLDGQLTIDKSLLERKEILEKNIRKESPLFSLSRHIEKSGISFFHLAKEQGLEGIVAKRKGSKYHMGKRTKDWIKCKAFLDEDFLVCGYYFKTEQFLSIVLGSFHSKSIIYRGHVVMGVSKKDFQFIQASPTVTKQSTYRSFPDFPECTWIQPALVCVVQFMEYTDSGNLRQPVFRGLRFDKHPEECVYHKP